MTASVERFIRTGPTQAQLEEQIAPGITAVPSPVAPPAILDIALSDDTARQDLSGYLETLGYTWSETNPASGAPVTIWQIRTSAKNTDSSGIGTTWTTIWSQTVTTKGGSSLACQALALCDVVIGGKARILIDGGSYSDATVGPEVTFPLLNGALVTPFWPTAIAAGSSTTYTFKLQIKSVGALSSISCDASSSPTTNAARLSIFEYRGA